MTENPTAGMLTAQRLIERSLTVFADRLAVIDGAKTLTYKRLNERSARLANTLSALGIAPGDAAAVLLPNEARFVEIDVASARTGMVRVAMGTRLSPDEIHYIVNHSGSKVIFTTSTLYEKLDTTKLIGVEKVFLMDVRPGTKLHTGRELDYENMLAQAKDSWRSGFSVAGDHPSFIMYTSGTTGRPKGATHSHAGRAAATVNMLASEIRYDNPPRMLHCAPLSHGSGSKLIAFMALGGCNVVLPRFEPGEFAQAIEQHGGTHSFMVPTMLQMLLDGGPKICASIRKMRQISFGGAPITDALFGRSIEGFGGILTQVYGSSEAPHPITVMQPEDYMNLPDPASLAQTAGRASHGSDVSIVDDDGRPLPPNQEGELWVRGAHVMQGYWRNEQATAEAFAPGRWYKTGDVAIIDDAGFIAFRDRKRDLIISGGLNVYPSEVERVLAEHPSVKEVAVIAYPDERWGESVMACVVANEGELPTEAALIDWTGQSLAGYKKPRKILFMDELPKGSTNKILKRELKARFWQGRSRRIN